MEQAQQSWDFAQGSPDGGARSGHTGRAVKPWERRSRQPRERMGALLGRSLHQSALTRAEQGERPLLSAAELLAAAEVLGTTVWELVAPCQRAVRGLGSVRRMPRGN